MDGDIAVPRPTVAAGERAGGDHDRDGVVSRARADVELRVLAGLALDAEAARRARPVGVGV